MAHTQRQPTQTPDTEAERFLDHANDMLRDARIKGITSVDTCRTYLEYESRHQARKHVLDTLTTRMREIRSQS